MMEGENRRSPMEQTTCTGWDRSVRFSWETELIEPVCSPIYPVKHTHTHIYTHNWLYINRIYVLYIYMCVYKTYILFIYNQFIYIYIYIWTYLSILLYIYTHINMYIYVYIHSSIHRFMYIFLSSSLTIYLPTYFLLALFLWRPLRIHVHTHTNIHIYIQVHPWGSMSGPVDSNGGNSTGGTPRNLQTSFSGDSDAQWALEPH